MDSLLELIESLIILKILIPILIIIYFIVLLAKIWDIANYTRDNLDNKNTILENLTEINNNLERIATAIESSDSEPYIIENNDNEFSDNRSSTGNP